MTINVVSSRDMGKKLFVGGLAWATDDAKLRAAFEKYGTVTEARVITDRETNRSRGFGFVTYSRDEDAAAAITNLDGTSLDGRNVRVNAAEEKAAGARTGGPRPGGYSGGGGYSTDRGSFGGGGAPPERSWGDDKPRRKSWGKDNSSRDSDRY